MAEAVAMTRSAPVLKLVALSCAVAAPPAAPLPAAVAPPLPPQAPTADITSALPEIFPLAMAAPKEIGGQSGPDPTRFGDWEKDGICSDF